jgi:hypothetical protein
VDGCQPARAMSFEACVRSPATTASRTLQAAEPMAVDGMLAGAHDPSRRARCAFLPLT